ncbi:MAG TPA: ABC transporter ATP-binding protein [bacterium]|nr:ABC transporter ATP-binding protein [bacterium]
MNTAIKIRNISKRFNLGEIRGYKTIRETLQNLFRLRVEKPDIDYIWALKNVSADIQNGDVVGVIGRNGAGKSTLLKIISRITGPTEGIIELHGRVASLLEVGTGFHPELTGRENIFLNGVILGMKRAEIKARFDDIVGFAEVEKFLDTPVKRYSSGMYVRLAFAVAAHLESEILIVDEVLSVGDVEFQKKCLGKMKEISRKAGRTVLFVSHNMSAISSLCTRGLLLERGRLVYAGTAKDTVKNYLEAADKVGRRKMEWIAPDKKYPFMDAVRINRFYVVDKNGNIPEGKLFNSKQYDAVIEADLIQSDSRLIFNILYYGDDGTILFGTDVHDTGEINFGKVLPGRIKLSVPVPTELFANKAYRLELICAMHYTGWILPAGNESMMGFEFFRDVDFNPYSNDTRLGLLSPVLKWKLSRP